MFASLLKCLSLGNSHIFQDIVLRFHRHKESFYMYSSFPGFHSTNLNNEIIIMNTSVLNRFRKKKEQFKQGE